MLQIRTHCLYFHTWSHCGGLGSISVTPTVRLLFVATAAARVATLMVDIDRAKRSAAIEATDQQAATAGTEEDKGVQTAPPVRIPPWRSFQSWRRTYT